MDETEPTQHVIEIETEKVGMGERHRAVCSCGDYRSTRESQKSRAEQAGWQHARRMGMENVKPDSVVAIAREVRY